jgi:hypothetical protein
MLTLAKEEIMDQLKRLGINASSERNAYLRDYINYVAHHKVSLSYHSFRIMNEDIGHGR